MNTAVKNIGKKTKQSKIAQVSEKKLRKCDICHKESETEGDDLVLFGDWKESKGLCVHYFCLLLSTNLPQTGEDCSGILGFLIRDIRQEIKQAAKRTCCYCAQKHASICCHKCKEYFHLVCGTAEKCLFQFEQEYLSYCNKCVPLSEKHEELLRKPPSEMPRCYICNDVMGPYNCVQWIYGPCCKHGFVHRICMLKFALNAGYYLRCLWCRKTIFRDLIRQFGIYIPDRDAMWEGKLGNYTDLHRAYRRCDVNNCLCPQGRDYVNKKWALVICMLCGSYGAHNPICITKDVKSKEALEGFKCDICSTAEEALAKEKAEKTLENHNKSISVRKINATICDSASLELPVVSNEDICSTAEEAMAKEKAEKTLENHNKSISVRRSNATICDSASLELPVVSNEAPYATDSNLCCCDDANTDNRVHVKTLEFEEKNGIVYCKGTLILCINRKEERFTEKSLEEIVKNHLFEDKDIICRSSDTGVFRIIEDIIAEYVKK